MNGSGSGIALPGAWPENAWSGAGFRDIEGVSVDASGVVAGFGGTGGTGTDATGFKTERVGASAVIAWEETGESSFLTGLGGTAEVLNDGGGVREEAIGVEANGGELGFGAGIGSGGIGFPDGETEIFTIDVFSSPVFCGLISMFVFNL